MMQGNVDKIIIAAEAVNRFNYVSDEIFDENDIYPALVVGDRRSEIRKRTENLGLYFLEWQYQVFVLVNKSDGWEELELLTAQFLSQSAAQGLYLVDWRMMEMLISGIDVLVSEIILGTVNKHQFA